MPDFVKELSQKLDTIEASPVVPMLIADPKKKSTKKATKAIHRRKALTAMEQMVKRQCVVAKKPKIKVQAKENVDELKTTSLQSTKSETIVPETPFKRSRILI